MGLVEILKQVILFFSNVRGGYSKTVRVNFFSLAAKCRTHSGGLEIVQKTAIDLEFRSEEGAAGAVNFVFTEL